MMKKITFLLIAILSVSVIQAQDVLSHSTDQTIANGLVACSNADSGFTTENSYWRTYTPADFSYTGMFDIQGVNFALSFTDTGATDPTMIILVKAYTTSGFPGGGLTLVASKTVTVTVADDLTLIEVLFDEAVPVSVDTEIALEVNMESGETAVVDFRIAGNDLGEDAPSYISTPDCGGINPPVTYASIGFPDSHMIIDLKGGVSTASIADNIIAGFEMFPNPVIDILTLKADATIEAVSIYNMIGQEVISTSNTTIDMSHLPTGSYIVKVQAGDQVGSYNFIKQ